MTDHEDASQPGGRQDFGCGLMFWLYIVVFPIVGWIVYPILKQVFGKAAPYALVAGCGAVLLWGWFRERRRRLGGRSL